MPRRYDISLILEIVGVCGTVLGVALFVVDLDLGGSGHDDQPHVQFTSIIHEDYEPAQNGNHATRSVTIRLPKVVGLTNKDFQSYVNARIKSEIVGYDDPLSYDEYFVDFDLLNCSKPLLCFTVEKRTRLHRKVISQQFAYTLNTKQNRFADEFNSFRLSLKGLLQTSRIRKNLKSASSKQTTSEALQMLLNSSISLMFYLNDDFIFFQPAPSYDPDGKARRQPIVKLCLDKIASAIAPKGALAGLKTRSVGC